jgi:hypothetical protein
LVKVNDVAYKFTTNTRGCENIFMPGSGFLLLKGACIACRLPGAGFNNNSTMGNHADGWLELINFKTLVLIILSSSKEKYKTYNFLDDTIAFNNYYLPISAGL